MAVDLSYQNDPRWGSFTDEEKSAYDKERLKQDYNPTHTEDQLKAYKDTAAVSYEYKKKQLEDTRAQQEALNAQRQQYSQQDEARDYQQANQAYRY
jgi:hypothetical protein